PQPRHTLSSTRTPPTETYPLSLHDALPIYERVTPARERPPLRRRVLHVTRDQVHGLSHGPRRAAHRAPDTDGQRVHHRRALAAQDRKSTRLNSSHVKISYAVFCLKKKKKQA